MRGLLRSGKAIKTAASTEPIDDFGDAEIHSQEMDRPFRPRTGRFSNRPDRGAWPQPETLSRRGPAPRNSDDPAPILRTGGRAHPAQLGTDTELQ